MADHETPRDIEAEIAEWRQLHPAKSEPSEQWLREHPENWALLRLPSGQVIKTRSESRPLREAANELFVALRLIGTG